MYNNQSNLYKRGHNIMQRKNTKPVKIKHDKHHIRDLEQKRRNQLFQSHRHTSSHYNDQKGKLGLGRAQMTGIFFLLLLSNAYAINVHSQVTQAPASNNPAPKKLTTKEKQQLKEKTYKDVCTNSTLTTYNKPNVTLGANNGKLMLKSCMDRDLALCIHEQQLYRLHKANNHVQPLRDKITVDFQSWLKIFNTEVAKINPSMTQQQLNDFHKIYIMIQRFKEMEITAKHTNDAQGGHCGEHTKLDMRKLFQAKIAYDIPMEIAYVKMSSSTSNEPITDHVYALLDSDASEVKIVNDEKAVNKVLAKSTKGKICDDWNHGYYVDFISDTSGLYKKDAKWDNLEIIIYSLNFKNFKRLPRVVQQFFCKEFQAMGFDIEPKGSCSSKMFKKSNNNKKKKTHTPTSKQEL